MFASQCTLYCKAIIGAGMRDLDKALADITAIRSQMARGAEFRGYGPMTVAATGALARRAPAMALPQSPPWSAIQRRSAARSGFIR